MRKKFLGKKSIEEKNWIFYYITKRGKDIYGVLILFLQEENGKKEVDWEWIDGLTKSKSRAEQIGMQCMRYLVTPTGMAESLDEILSQFL